MATVTGFTAERMLVIENETVVDGEVRDTNLFLIRRDGVEIDAGWVKGAPGGMGPQGPPGVIQSINDEVKPIAYSPRVFDTKAELDAWVNAPYGSVGVVRDSSQTIWQKDTVGWFLVNGMRIFASVAERDSRWLNPPDGSICQAPVGTEYQRVNGVWNPVAPPRRPQSESRYLGVTTDGSASALITFIKAFSTTPNIQLTNYTTGGGGQSCIWTVLTPSASNFKALAYNSGTNTNWVNTSLLLSFFAVDQGAFDKVT